MKFFYCFDNFFLKKRGDILMYSTPDCIYWNNVCAWNTYGNKHQIWGLL